MQYLYWLVFQCASNDSGRAVLIRKIERLDHPIEERIHTAPARLEANVQSGIAGSDDNVFVILVDYKLVGVLDKNGHFHANVPQIPGVDMDSWLFD